MIKANLDYLRNSDAVTKYGTKKFLLNIEDQDLRNALISDERVLALLKEVKNYPWPAFTRHQDSKHPVHKLGLLAEMGLTVNDAGLSELTDEILKHQNESGALEVILNIPKGFGGTGEDMWTWVICDAPVQLSTLAALGVKSDQLKKAAEHLFTLISENGFRCRCDEKLGKFKGPGSRTSPCPIANLASLKALSFFPEYHDQVQPAIEMLFTHWEKSYEWSPFLFKTGKDFRKLKAPLLWYNVLHVAEVLSRFDVKSDPRFLEMVQTIESKADENGLFKAESVYQCYKAFDFGQKKTPSAYLTLQVYRLLNRLNRLESDE